MAEKDDNELTVDEQRFLAQAIAVTWFQGALRTPASAEVALSVATKLGIGSQVTAAIDLQDQYAQQKQQ